MYSAIVMMYASYIIEGKWDIENTPPMLRPMIEELIADLTKKPVEGE